MALEAAGGWVKGRVKTGVSVGRPYMGNRTDKALNEDICNETGKEGRGYREIKRAGFFDSADWGTYGERRRRRASSYY